MSGQVRERLVELEVERSKKLSAIAGLEDDERSPRQDASLLDELPLVDAVDLFVEAPDDEVRNVFDAFRLELLYDKEARGVTIRVTVSERTVAALRLGGDRRLVTTQAADGPARPFLFFWVPPEWR